MDADGYPTDEELERIRKWPHEDFAGLMEFIYNQCWNSRERGFAQSRRRFRLATSGWSGNEEVISALGENVMFMALCWQSSHRGGLHKFEIPSWPKNKPPLTKSYSEQCRETEAAIEADPVLKQLIYGKSKAKA